MIHGCCFAEDDEDWTHVQCTCGWSAGPFPGQEDAADAFGDHMYNAGFKAAADRAREALEQTP